MGRPRKYATEEDRLAAKKQFDQERARSRIAIGTEIARWKLAKADAGLSSDAAFAKLLLDK